MTRRAIGAMLVASSSLVAKAASAEPLVWGSGSWGDVWLGGASSVPALSPPSRGLLAVALVVVVAIALRRRPAFSR